MNRSVCVVTVNYKTEEGVNSIVDWLRAGQAELPCRLVVVSNSGDMPSVRPVAGLLTDVSGGNIGFGRACNRGRALAPEADFLVFVNPDIVASFGVVTAMCDLLAQNRGVGIIAPYTHPSAAVFAPTGRVNDVGTSRNIGSMFAMRASDFDELGGFDESFFLWFEDTDLRNRVLRRGLRVGMADGVVVVHSGGASYKQPSLVTSRFLTRVWLVSHAYFRVKWSGRLNAGAWVLGCGALNLGRALSGRGSPRGRPYCRPWEVARLAPWLLVQVLFRPRHLAFDGRPCKWWPRSLQEP